MLTTLAAALVLHSAPLAVNKVMAFQGFHSLAYAAAPTGSKFAASLEDFSVRIIDANKRATVMTLFGHPQQVYGLAFNPAGTMLATGDESGRIWTWDLKSGKKIKEFDRTKGHIRGIQALNFSPDGKLIASTGKDDTIIIWDVKSGKRIKQILGKGANVASAVFNPKGGSVLAGTIGAGVQFYKTGTYDSVAQLSGCPGGMNDISTAKNGSVVVAGGRMNDVVVWDMAKKKRVGALKGHDDMVMHVAISPNAKYAASSANDRNVVVWNLATMTKEALLGDQSAIGSPLAFTGDGKFLITASVSDTIQIYELSPAQGAAEKATRTKRRRR